MDNNKNLVLEDNSKSVMLFGRDIRRIPCFKHSMLYGIYSGFAAGLLTFMFTSRVKLSTDFALGSYIVSATAYWFYCRYNFVKQKYELSEIQQMIQLSKTENKIFNEETKPEEKLEDA